MPFANAGIRQAGANFMSQVGDISTRTAANLGNIMMQIAQIKAQGIVEGSRAWQNALEQIGVTAQNYPVIRRQMQAEKRAEEDQAFQREQMAQWRVMAPLQQKQTQQQITQAAELFPIQKQQAQQTAESGEYRRTLEKRAMDFQTLKDDLVAQNLKQDPTTQRWSLDNNAVMSGLAQKGFGQEAIALQKTEEVERINLAKMKRDEAVEHRKAVGELYGHYQAVLDAAKQNAPLSTQQALYGAARRATMEADPETPEELLPPIYDPSVLPMMRSFAIRTAKNQADLDVVLGRPPTAAERDREADYSNWLETTGKPRNATSEREFRDRKPISPYQQQRLSLDQQRFNLEKSREDRIAETHGMGVSEALSALRLIQSEANEMKPIFPEDFDIGAAQKDAAARHGWDLDELNRIATGGAKSKAPTEIKLGDTATNPTTGQKIRWDGKQWQPVGK